MIRVLPILFLIAAMLLVVTTSGCVNKLCETEWTTNLGDVQGNAGKDAACKTACERIAETTIYKVEENGDCLCGTSNC